MYVFQEILLPMSINGNLRRVGILRIPRLPRISRLLRLPRIPRIPRILRILGILRIRGILEFQPHVQES